MGNVWRSAYVHLVLPLFVDLPLRLLPLLVVFRPGRYRADLDSLHLVGEVDVEREGIVIVDLPPCWVLL